MNLAREIIRLGMTCNLPSTDIANSCGVDPKTVRNYFQRIKQRNLSDTDIERLTDEQLSDILKNKRGRRPEHQSKKPDFEYIDQELKRKGVTRQLLWEEYIADHPTGYKRTQFFHLFRQWKKNLNLSMRQSHIAGEKLFVDYSGQTVTVHDPSGGAAFQAQIFVGVLGASNYAYAEATKSQGLSDWIGSHTRNFRFLGGVPEIVVPDNLKSGVTRPCRYDPDINREYQEMSVHYGTAIMPARVRAPQDKSKAENGVLLVQRWILATLRNRIFFSLEELNREISTRIERLNDRPFKKISGSRRSLFEAVDKPALKPLPTIPYTFAEWNNCTVGMDYHIGLNGHFYSVPFKHTGKSVTVRYTDKTVEVFLGTMRIASHLRDDTPREASTLVEHMTKSHRKYKEWTPNKILTRSEQIGESTLEVVHRLIKAKQHPMQAYRAAVGIIGLEKKYSPGRLEIACKRALRIGGISYKSILSILQNGLDHKELLLGTSKRKEELAQKAARPIHHENVRGEDYYLQLMDQKGGTSC